MPFKSHLPEIMKRRGMSYEELLALLPTQLLALVTAALKLASLKLLANLQMR